MIYTIGHGLSGIKEFFDTLKANGIDTLVDVRSKPYSRRAPQFNQGKIETACANENIAYCWLGNSLGGFGETPQNLFLGGIDELITKCVNETIVIMCSETNYKKCHRFYKISPELEKQDIAVTHLMIKREQTRKDFQTALFK